jgi:hypothetical protein
MSEDEKYTLSEAQSQFAKSTNGRVWELLENDKRTQFENEEMLHAAHASLYHWLCAGTGLNHQRGLWMVAKVHTVLGNSSRALHYANRCLELTEMHSELMEDFDIAFAYECVARANALSGNDKTARSFLAKAVEAGSKISDDEDREIFFADFNGGDWFGIQ